MLPTLSICIPTYRGHKRIMPLLHSLADADLARSDFEIIIADDGSPIEENDVLRESATSLFAEDALFITHTIQNAGWSAAVTRAVCLTRGENVLLLDDDTTAPDTLPDTVNNLLKIPEIGVLNWRSYGSKPGQSQTQTAGFLEPATCLAGYCMAFRHKVWARLGGFDSRFRVYCGDSDFALRATLAGYPSYRVWWPLVPHAEHGSFADAPELGDRSEQAARDLAAFSAKWGCSMQDMETQALAKLRGR